MFGRDRIEYKTPDQIRLMRRAGLVVGETLAPLRERSRRRHDHRASSTRSPRSTSAAAGRRRPSSATTASPATLCVSVNDEVVHGIPGSRVLVEGDLVSIDCGAIVDGWHGDAADHRRRRRSAGGRPRTTGADRRDRGVACGPGSRRWPGRLAAVRRGCGGRGRRRRRGPGPVTPTTASSRTTSATASAPRCTRTPQVPNYRVRDRGPTVRPGLCVAIEPMVTLGSAETRVLDDDWTVVTARRLAAPRTGSTRWPSPRTGSGCSPPSTVASSGLEAARRAVRTPRPEPHPGGVRPAGVARPGTGEAAVGRCRPLTDFLLRGVMS